MSVQQSQQQHATYLPPPQSSGAGGDWCSMETHSSFMDIEGNEAIMVNGAGQQASYNHQSRFGGDYPRESTQTPSTTNSPNVDDGLTSLSWLQNLNMCMTRLGAPTPPTPPASPNCSLNGQHHHTALVTAGSLPHLLSSHLLPTHPLHHSGTAQPAVAASSAHPSNRNSSHVQSNQGTSTTAGGGAQSRGESRSSKKAAQQAAAAAAAEVEPIDYKTNGSMKPPFSYATLICMAMKVNKNKMTLNSIYKWIRENFLYYQNADPSWQNSIRHNLSLNKCFIKIPRTKDEPGKGGFWRLDPVYAETLVDGVFKKRRPSHKGANGTHVRKKNRKKSDKSEQSGIKKCGTQQQQHQHQLDNMSRPGSGVTQDRVNNIHETPPNSAESYTYIEAVPESIELVSAVHSIDGQIGNLHPCAIPHQYTPFVGQGGHDVNSGYADEVCVATGNHHHHHPGDSSHCILGAESSSDICWNAILTDADLELVDPTNYAGQVVHTSVSGEAGPCATSTTTQLTAVEPHGLHLAHGVSSSPGVGAEETVDMYAIDGSGGVHVPVSGTDVISANHNVVTCVNQTGPGGSQAWASWPVYGGGQIEVSHDPQHQQQLHHHQQQQQQQSQAVDMIHVNGGGAGSMKAFMRRDSLASNNPSPAASCLHIVSQRSSMTSEPPSGTHSPHSSHSFDGGQVAIQPWVECKAALEAAALDLEHFTELESVHSY